MDSTEAGVIYGYLYDRLSTIQTRSSKYYYNYDPYSGVSSIGVGSASGTSAAYTLRSYTYTEGGIRNSKTVGGVKTQYYLDGSRIVRENRNGTIIDYYYDDLGNVVGFMYDDKDEDPNDNYYYFGRNLQGDVVELYCNGSLVGQYEYDAWGNILAVKDGNGGTITDSSSAAMVNPFRYRGYYYDSETGLYYLNSRYYDPAVRRFISADMYIATGDGFVGYNMFVYCVNNPVNGTDPCGTCFHRLDFWNDCEECGDRTVGDKWREYWEHGVTLAGSVGFYGSVNVGIYEIAGSVEVAVDLKGNIQLIGSGSFDFSTAGKFSITGGVSGSLFLVPDTSYLAGDTYYTGGSFYVLNPAANHTVGISGNVGRTSDGFWGLTGGLGIGTMTALGADFHAGYTRTVALTEQINIFDWMLKSLLGPKVFLS